MIEGKCPNCGNRYFGWALKAQQHQTCDACGVKLEVIRNGLRVFTGGASAEKDSIKPKNQESADIRKDAKQ